MLDKLQHLVDQHHEKIDAAVSYGIGGGIAAWAVSTAQNLTIFFGLLIVLVRLIYDTVRLYRYIMSDKP